jgi:hypothetical protein
VEAGFGERSPTLAVTPSTTIAPDRPLPAPNESVQSPEATLRVERDPELVRISAVKVEASSVFAHLYPDGSVIVDEFDHDEDDD